MSRLSNLGRVSTYPCSILYIVHKKRDQKMTDPFKYVIHLGRFDCTHDLPDGRPSVFLSHLGNSEKANALALRHILPASVSPPSESVWVYAWWDRPPLPCLPSHYEYTGWSRKNAPTYAVCQTQRRQVGLWRENINSISADSLSDSFEFIGAI